MNKSGSSSSAPSSSSATSSSTSSSSASSSSSSGLSTGKDYEYAIRSSSDCDKKYHMMRFSKALNLEVEQFRSAKMIRENNLREMKFEDDKPKFGAGSEFGREQRIEARRKMYGIRSKRYNPDDQPWLLKLGSGKTAKRFKGIRDGGVSENASYYVFFQANDGAFEAFPVGEWYNFTPIQRFKALSAEEAEEQFEKRHKILNHFAVMYQKKKGEGEGGTEQEEKMVKGAAGRKKDFKVSDMDAWDPDSEGDRSMGDDDDDEKPSVKKNKGKGKKKKKNDSDAESEGKEDSDDGDLDDRELDYISDTSSEEDDELEGRKDEADIKGVEDEEALRDLFLSDDSDEEGEENADKDKTDAEKDPTKAAALLSQEPKKDKDSDGSSSGSDDSDLDESKFESSIFMQEKTALKGVSKSANNSRSGTPTVDGKNGESASGKRKEMSGGSGAGDSSSAGPGASKKARLGGTSTSTPGDASRRSASSEEGITEETVRRYLIRKPMTTTELLQKFKKVKRPGPELVTLIANILKKLNPQKQKVNGKMYLSIKA